MGTIVLAHGAWSAAWAWKKMRPLFRAAGHEFFSPSYTGLGERAHLARPEIDLSTHIQDVLAVLEFENLTDVTLLGHSYGGMVATGVVDKARERIARVVYIDAFAPKDGQSLFDLVGPKAEGNMRAGATKDGDGWRLPINARRRHAPGIAWASPRANAAHPDLRAEAETESTDRRRRATHYATRNGPGDVFRQFSERARSGPANPTNSMPATPHITCPDALMALLTRIMPNTWADK
jgi:pimeloyl-ACP methyl ester carboxylesterase